MGKNKQAQRTKNNARPSNSSRSAELLGTAIPNFVGFSAVKDGGYVPILPGLSLCTLSDVEINSVDSIFQVVLKKMSKKDATTKYKALQEFATLCKDAELSAVEGMLPFWPRLYCALSIDIDHRVREAAQLAHAAVVKRVGKGIAMYLKQLAGAWFISQYDTYPPAAWAAANSFNSTFPPQKIVDAIVHCQWEILMYINDNIIVHTAQTLSVHKSLTSEEMETKYQRILVASLQAYSSYFKQVPLREIEKTAQIHSKILSTPKFWKLAKHDALPIKTTFFCVLTSIMENAVHLLQDEKKRAVTAVTNSLDESEPGVLSVVWESMLVVITKIDDWHHVVNVEKLVLPKLWRILRSGGQCCASIVYPNLLPFVSQFSKLSVNVNDLYTNFFNNIRQGFSIKSVLMSRSETQAVITSFVECLRYTILVNAENVDLCVQLFKTQFMPAVETACLTENAFMRKLCFCEIAHLVRYWSKNRANESYKSYVLLMQQFWIELRLLFDKLINVPPEMATAVAVASSSSAADVMDAQIELLTTLKNAPDHIRKKLKVKFSNANDSAANQPEVNIITENDADPCFNAEFCEFVNALCAIYFDKIKNQQSMEYIGQLNKIMKNFANRELFGAPSALTSFNKDFFEFYDHSLRLLLLSDSAITGQVVELIFYFIPYISDVEKEKILKMLMELNNTAITKSVVHCGLSKCNRNDEVIKKLYTQSSVTKLLIDVANEIVLSQRDDVERNQQLILLALETSESGHLLISEDTANEIVSIFCNSLNDIDDICSTQFIQFVTRLMTLVWSHERTISSAVQILETLFELCTREHNDGDVIPSVSVRDDWKEGLVRSSRILSRSEFNDLISRCAIIIWSKIYNAHAAHTEMLMDLATDVLEVIMNNDSNLRTNSAEEIILLFLTASDIRSWIAKMTAVAIYGEIVTGSLYVSNLREEMQILQRCMLIDITSDTTSDNLVTCLSWALYTTDLLNNLHRRLNAPDANDDCDAPTDKTVKLRDLDFPGITEILMNILHVAAAAEIYGKHYRSTKCYNDISKILDSLKTSLRSLQGNFARSIRDGLLSHIRANRANYGYMLPYIIREYCSEFEWDTDPVEFYESCWNDEEERDWEAYVQAIQILSDHWTLDDGIPSLTSNDIYMLIAARITMRLRQDSSLYIAAMAKVMLYKDSALLLLNCDISDIPWSQLLLPLEVIRLLTVLIQRVPSRLTHEHWDFVLISLVMWQQSITKSRDDHADIKLTTLTIAISQLYCELQDFMDRHEREPVSELLVALLDEWKMIFAGDIHGFIVRTWMSCADSHNADSATVRSVIPLDHLGRAISMLNKNVLFKKHADMDTEPIDIDRMLELSLKFLQSSVPSIQLSAYHALKHTVLKFVQQDKVLIESDSFEPTRLNIKKFEKVLLRMQNIVKTMLIDFKLCDTISCTIQPFTDSYTYTLGYLLAWAVVLDICANAHGDLRYQYAEILKDDHFPCLLNNIFKLMPVEVLQDNKNKNRTVKLQEIFSVTPSFSFGESWTEGRLDHIVCWLYTNCLRHLPVLVRQWWSTADSRVSATIDKITSHYVSPMLCQEELLNNRLINLENMQVKVHPTAREVVALYQMDDTRLELSIVLPPNHPLGTVTVEPGQHAGGTANWRNCHMQLSIFLTHQNGSVWDGLVMWKRNLDKKFASVEECYICFSIFHISTYQIPKLSCHTCRKKFHTPCLYKWFNTSQKSTCPICRNVF